MTTSIYLFDEDGAGDSLVLHVPSEPGSHMAACGVFFNVDNLYLPDDDEELSSFCTDGCAEAWIEVQTTNKHNWSMQ